ncbi:MAG: UDP-N-acetylmuramate--L-alanine ligase [Chthonomonas sp.]|nr:UDP-N-acetylmuramate--L-alanine ligase [Chthonomonas sp.]
MRTKVEIASSFASTADLGRAQRFFFVGIGGAGMSGLAHMLMRRGYQVAGSDSTDSAVIDALRAAGAKVQIGHDNGWVMPGDALILTDAIDLNESPEVQDARRGNNPIFRRSQLLGWLLDGKRVIAVTGTHGKTTTTGLVASALLAGGLDPTAIVGAEVPDFGGAVREGAGDWVVIEACEAYDSLRDLPAEIVVLTNLEPDHLDFHGDWESLLASVNSFVSQASTLVYCKDDAGACEVAAGFAGTLLPYGAEGWDSPDSQLMRMPGRHNWQNARAALSVAHHLGVGAEPALRAVQTYSGAERRLQLLREGEIAVLDDYAHHPTEITASIEAVRSRYAGRRVVVVYQPHLYSRTRDFLPEFARTLSAADLLVITDIYPAREAPMPGMSSARIAEQVTCEVVYVPSRHRLPTEVRKLVRAGDVVVGMGAGNISEFGPAFLAELDRPAAPQLVVLYGGDSAEREVSLHSGRAVANALSTQYSVRLLDATELLLGQRDLAPLTGVNRPDLAVLMTHGNRAEDGALQGFLELIGVPYTGPGIQSSALAMDKEKTKEILRAAGLPVPPGVQVTANEDPQHAAERVLREVGGDEWVVKPNAQGSTIGVTFVNRPEDLAVAIAKGLHYDSSVLVERRLRGMEISTPVMGDRALIPVEIAPTGGKDYDFESKYTPGATEEICPARLPEETMRLVSDLALRTHQLLGCRGVTRTDMIVTAEGPIILEINTLPGMTPTSLVPKSAETAGMSFAELCQWIVEDALTFYGAKAR